MAAHEMIEKNILSSSIVSAVVGLIACVAYGLTVDLELIGAVLLVIGPPFFVSVAFVFILEAISANRVVKLAAFVSPLFVMIGITANAMWIDSQKVVSDGAGELSRFYLKTSLVGLAAASACLLVLMRRGRIPIKSSVEQSTDQSSNE